jgi:hypothetical protein
MHTAARWPHAIAGSPAAVLIAAGLVEPADIADADITVVARGNAGCKRQESE